MPVCAICQHLSTPARAAAGTVGLLTNAPDMVASAVDSFETVGTDQHIIVHACPEHVVDVYRGRIEGIRMAWRLVGDTATPFRQSPAAVSASRA
ncbi:MAG: hypothetical protein IT300_03630 [Dehalococcoidia bacterium]|nr:hypothetical protein [Dehalococcoidia bacterium]